MSRDPTQRIRNEYGGIKEAISYCFFTLKLSQLATARQLCVYKTTVKKWSDKYKIYPLDVMKQSPECRGVDHDGKRKTFLKINAMRKLIGLGYSKSDPEAHYKAEKIAGIR